MRSTFMGLETSKRGLYTQQSALYTTGHNIANANTPGYTRQRVNMQATSGFPGIGLNAGTQPGFLGTGVEAGSIQRIRDSFVDYQYRGEANKLGYWESRSKAIAHMEDVLGEPSEYGLQQSISDFWQSLQTLATNPENGGARAVVVERGVEISDSFNYVHKLLSEIRNNYAVEIDFSANDINTTLKQISELNRQIADVEPNGFLPNDLYDARDGLLDKLATHLPIEVSYEKTGGRALAFSEGTVTIQIKTTGAPITVLQKLEYSTLTVDGKDTDGNLPEHITGFTFNGPPATNRGDGNLPVGNMVKDGELSSHVESYGYVDAGTPKGLYTDMLVKIDKMAAEFATVFNKIHTSGTDLQGQQGKDFFIAKTGGTITASSIGINDILIKNPNKVAASTSEPESGPEVGNGGNAKKLADALFKKLPGLGGSSLQTYYSQAIGELGVAGQQAVKMTDNTGTLLLAISNRRDSIISVSLDEEMTDMIRFQQAYNASARMITVMDEAIDKIVNGMGLSGR
ncbi:flagellar hook-associated protein FlgK [Sporosarcina sp. P13]|uniref:flagellar hook-associated protein FlgK n=1 Tax=Sporosarcina sp. P13 TaxID=2048263 RepID=UPI000C16316A|nr:flagellar hook-associated protein FlgK [Sporosarcina sp. P13]PIC62957.1 flagellar hook-associated protein FlgK [Sporosarcina sp. P13]